MDNPKCTLRFIMNLCGSHKIVSTPKHYVSSVCWLAIQNMRTLLHGEETIGTMSGGLGTCFSNILPSLETEMLNPV